MTERVRIGVLGAARIVGPALVRPARRIPEVAVMALAARDRARAKTRADELGIPIVHDSYAALLADPDLDAVYIPLPNSLHAPWGLRALEAGKHVLIEKPVASNAAEARQLAAAAGDRIVCEAMHSRYHRLWERLDEIDVGDVRHVEATIAFPIPKVTDVRWQYDLGGGALMDLGVYAVSLVRLLAGAEPEVTGADALLRTANVDRRVDARLRFAGGGTGRVLACMWGRPVLGGKAVVVGSRGKVTVRNPFGSHPFNQIVVEVDGATTRERVPRRPDSYSCQLRAFAGAVLRGEALRTGPEDFVANMAVIDAIYEAAGMPLRRAPAAL